MEHLHYLGRVITPGQSESVQSRVQLGVENIGLATPVVGDKFGGFEIGRGWIGELSVEQTVGQRGKQWGGDGGGGEDLYGKFVGSTEVGAVIQHEVPVRIYDRGVLLVAVSYKMSFSSMASWNAEVKVKIR